MEGVDITWVIGLIISLAVTVLGGIVRNINADTRSLQKYLDTTQKEVADFRVEVARSYVSHEQLSRIEARMDKKFDEIRALITEALKK